MIWSIMVPQVQKEVQMSCKYLWVLKDPPGSNRRSESPGVIGLSQAEQLMKMISILSYTNFNNEK